MKQTRLAVSARWIVLAFTFAAPLWSCGRQAPQAPKPAAAPMEEVLGARLGGAIDADLHSEGGARPDGNGIRVSLAGPLDAAGQRIRLVFGMAAPPAAASRRVVPTNVTLIVEGANRIFATLGEDKCSVDALAQQPVAGAPGAAGDYRVSARGFCVEPATTLDGSERVLLSRFDFQGRIHLDDIDLRRHADTP